MRVIRDIAIALAALATGAAVASSTASAQAMTPMRGEVKSFSDKFAVRVFPMNPYQHRIKIEVKVYDETFAPIGAMVMPAATMLAPLDSRSVMVMVPFDGQMERRVRVCTESVPFSDQSQRVRTQVCGRFIAKRLQ